MRVRALISGKEQQVLEGLMDGLTNKRIADRFGCTESTVKVHIKSLLRKLNMKTRTELAVLMVRRLPCPRCGWIPEDGGERK
jgi:DNA-binding NarL/FixJ family response regulator